MSERSRSGGTLAESDGRGSSGLTQKPRSTWQKGRTFLARPLPQKWEVLRNWSRYWAQYVLAEAESWLIYPVPVHLPCGGWLWTGPDSTGAQIRAGGFETGECHFLARYLQKGMTALDVGAHVGFYSVQMGLSVGPTGCVLAFEPSPRERRRLRLNLALTRCRMVRVKGTALGASQGKADFYVVIGGQSGCNSLRFPAKAGPTKRIAVSVVSLDDCLAAERIERVDLVKMDVEGGELDVLRGARQLLTQEPRPVFLCELSNRRTSWWGYPAREIYEHFRAFHFQLYSVLPSGDLRPSPLRDDFDENLVALPQEREDRLGSQFLSPLLHAKS